MLEIEREILFRGKRKDNGEWIEGFYCKYGYTNQKKHYIIPTYASALYAVEVIPETVERYTGLKDKNGVKIFEGDIVHVNSLSTDIISAVIFEDGTFALDGNNNFTAFIHLYNQGFNIKIIGNIFDNPELLEGLK